MKLERYAQQFKKYHIEILMPDKIKRGFDDIAGMATEKENLLDALSFFKSLNSDSPLLVHPHTRFIIRGTLGSGKETLMNALAKDANVPIITFPINTFLTYPKRVKTIFALIFKVANSFKNGCVLNFKEISSTQSLAAKYLLDFYNYFYINIKNSKNTVIFISTCQPMIELTPALLSGDMFTKSITMELPSLKTRQKLFDECFEEYQLKLAPDVSSERLAKNTLGMYPKDILYTVRETALYAARKGIDVISMREFNDILLTMEVGGTNSVFSLSEKERLSTAYHEAGHVIAAYYSNPEYVLGRVEITPRSLSLGLTQEEISEEKFSQFKHELKYDIIYSLGGMAAEETVYGETSTGVSADLSSVAATVTSMFERFGMCKELGPLVFDGGDDDDDTSFGFISNEFRYKVECLEQTFIKDMYQETLNIITSHRKQLDALANALIEHEVLIGPEIKEILDNA